MTYKKHLPKAPSNLGAFKIQDVIPVEEGVIGAVLIDRMAIHGIAMQLDKPEMFYATQHQALWKIILRLHHAGKPIDMLTVMGACSPDELLAIGGPQRLAELSGMVASSANIEYHAGYVWQNYVGRQLITTCNQTAFDVSMGQDIPEVMYKHSQELYQLQHTGTSSTETAGAAFKKALEKAAYIHNKGGQIGQPIFGIPSLDAMIGGGEDGDTIIIAARPKTGKSSMANAIAKYHVLNKVPLYLGSSEMQNEKTVARLAAAISGVPTRVIESGKFFNVGSELHAIGEASNIIADAPFYMDDGELSIPKMRSAVNYNFHVNGVKTFMFDRIGLFREVLNATDDYKARMTVTGAMRELANKLGVIIIAFSQVNTEAEKTTHKRPNASQIFGGIAAQSNCTKSIILYRPQLYGMQEFMDGPQKGLDAKGRIEVYSVLNNYLDLGSVVCGFDVQSQCVVELFDDNTFLTSSSLGTHGASAPLSDEDLPF